MRVPFRKRVYEQDLEDEILAHLAIEEKQRIEAGETQEQARLSARREFGSIALWKEVTRSMSGYGWLESLVQDLKYAGRTMRKTPAFTAIAILTLGLGIGANTAIFSVVNAAMLRPLPFPDSDRLVRIFSVRSGKPLGGWSPMDVRDFAAAAHSFGGIVAYDHWRKNVSGILGSTEAEELVIGLVPGEYFRILRVKPILGRLFTPEESIWGKHFVAAITSTFWQTRFASDPGVIGRTLRINGENYEIVAVMPDVVPAWMDGTAVPIPIYTPFSSQTMWTDAARGGVGDTTLARLKPGIGYAQAASEIAALASRLAQDHPTTRGSPQRFNRSWIPAPVRYDPCCLCCPRLWGWS